jgi:hypothetical protein
VSEAGADRLAAAIAAGDAAAIRDLIAPLDEEARRPLAPAARSLVAGARRQDIYQAELAPALYAAYGVLGVAELRSLAWRARHLPDDIEVVLRGRSPERLEPIVTFLLEVVGTGRSWHAVRALVRDGVIPRPTSQAYTVGMLTATAWGDAATLVAADPGLAEDEVWRLFEVEGGGEDSLANHEKFFGDTWGRWFRSQAAADPAVRARSLDASLAALARDFSAYRAGWFSRFHESLAPTDAERVARTDAYVALLRSRIGPTVTFAVRALERIERAAGLDGERLLDAIGPVLAEAPASTATAAVGLVVRIGRPADHAATTLLDALAHRSADVQGAALTGIDRLVPGVDASLAAALDARLGEVAASKRPQATALARRLAGEATSETAPTETDTPAPTTAPPPTRPTDPLDTTRAIEPITTVEALVEHLAGLLESAEDPDALERGLDGISRLCAERPNGFDRLVAPITKRARALLARTAHPRREPFSGYDPRLDLCGVALAWTAGEAPAPLAIDDHTVRTVGTGAFLAARAHELAERAATQRAGPLLAAPTHRGGWIVPSALVDRLRATGGAADRHDFVGAVLRLAADGRAPALAAATGLPGEAAAAARYALGGDEPIGPTAAWWVAAARVRAPDADDPAVERRHPGLGPDAGRVAQLALRPTKRDPALMRGATALLVEPAPPRTIGLDLPTVQQVVALVSWGSVYDPGRDPTQARWMETVRPGHREPRAAVAAFAIGDNVDWWTARWSDRVALEPYLDAWTPLGPMARLLVGTALGQREAGERGLAADVVITAIEDGRLDAAALADGLERAAARGVDRPRRWADALGNAAAASPGHAAVVAEAIARVLPAVADRRPADLIDLVRLLQELVAELGQPVHPAAHDALKALSGTGGRLSGIARALLAPGG